MLPKHSFSCLTLCVHLHWRDAQGSRWHSKDTPLTEGWAELLWGCAGVCWARVNYLHGSCYGAVFWNCAGSSADNTEMFLLLLRRFHMELRFFCSSPTPPAAGVQGSERGHSQDRRPQMSHGISQTIGHQVERRELGEEGSGRCS